MKAIRVHEFGPPEVMRIEEVPEPNPGPDEIRIRVSAAGVNPVDTYIRSGAYGVKPELPYTPGLDAAGVVDAIGPGVTHFRVGQRVYTAGTITGAYAEKVLCRGSQVYDLPENASYAQGAAVYTPYGAAYRALFQGAHATAGETVLIHGASGGMGIGAVQLALAAGLTVIGTAGTEESRNLVAQQGAHLVVNHHLPGYLDEVLAFTDGRGVDVIIEALANVNLGKDLQVLAPNGRVAVVGSRGTVEINPRDCMTRETSIVGISLWNVTEQEGRSMHAAFGAGLRNGTLRPVVGREMSLSDAPLAHHAVMESSAYGKIVLVP